DRCMKAVCRCLLTCFMMFQYLPVMERAGDPEAMAVLALRLDDLAGELDVHRALTRAAVATAGMEPPPLVAVRDVASWLRGRADDLRRRALDLLSADRPWRRTGVFDHLVGVARHGWSGVVDGVKGIGSGLVTAGHILVEDAIEPGRLATAVVDGGPKGAGRELGRYADESLHTLVTAGRNLEALDPQVRARRFAHELRGDGFWAATED